MNRREWTVFSLGFGCAVAMLAGVLCTKWPAHAVIKDCAAKNLEVGFYTGDYKNGQFTLHYRIPSCMDDACTPISASIYQGEYVAVTFNNKS